MSDNNLGVSFPGVTGLGYVPTPPTVGWYQLDRIRFCLTYKPSRWHRFWMRVCLGWEWKDAA